MHFREARPDDAVAIATVHAESWRATYRGAYRDEYLDGDVLQDRIAVWEKRLSAPPANQFVVVAEENDAIVGFACAYGRDDERWGSLLDNLHVRRDLHRRGTGTHLLAEVAKWCRTHYPEVGLYLWVLEQNERAQAFYERMGASDRGGGAFVPPGGGHIDSRRYAWTCLADIRLPAEAGSSEWSVWRQDDNGSRFEVARGLSRAEAERRVRDFESLGHKQTYWLVPTRSGTR
jgi:ribosomal protein S18 acetylase RimI-like enzyme